MNTKLTLSIESQLIQEAKEVAKKHGKSLSKLIEQYLKSLTAPASERNEEKSALIKLKGCFSDPKISDDDNLQNALNKKYMQL
jgi:metal-responsive CopG/Arc/MetJ family transcriptional regulator